MAMQKRMRKKDRIPAQQELGGQKIEPEFLAFDRDHRVALPVKRIFRVGEPVPVMLIQMQFNSKYFRLASRSL